VLWKFGECDPLRLAGAETIGFTGAGWAGYIQLSKIGRDERLMGEEPPTLKISVMELRCNREASESACGYEMKRGHD
jgi:hypothetical protein